MKISTQHITKRTFLIAMVFVLIISCSPELDIQTAIPSGKKVKSIDVVFQDGYGDSPAYDGKIFSSVTFDKRGKITDWRRGGSSHELSNPFSSMNSKSISALLWELDYTIYTTDFFLQSFDVKNMLKSRMLMAEQLKKFTPAENTVMIDDERPLSIFCDNGKLRSSEDFEYDANGKLISRTVSLIDKSNSPEEVMSSTTQKFEYNSNDQLMAIVEGSKKTSLLYDTRGNVSELSITKEGVMMQRHQFSYDEDNLRTRTESYNKSNQLEYSQDFRYHYF